MNRYPYVMNNPLKYTDPEGHKIYPVPDIGEGVYYDDEADRYIFYSSIIGREAKYFGHGFSAITSMPGYKSGGAIYKVDSYLSNLTLSFEEKKNMSLKAISTRADCE